MSHRVDIRPGFDVQDIRHCLQLNICRVCRNEKEPGRDKKHYCEQCARKAYLCGQQQVVLDRSFGLTTSPYAEKIQCKSSQRGVRCKTWFNSPDKRKVTRCQRCRARLFAQEEALVSEEARYEVDEPRQGRVYTSLQRKVGRRIISTDYRKLELAEREENYVGLTFRRLTPEEIAKEYPPEKIAVMLVRAKRNHITGWVPDERSL